jgi:hypothetical protein
MPEPQERVLNSYIALREELKGRHAIIRGVIADATQRKFVLRPTILGELCYLQLRMICELIALGCLLVHGDIPAARAGRIQKAYAADWIINKLTALHPSFYPVPTDQVLDETGRVANSRRISDERKAHQAVRGMRHRPTSWHLEGHFIARASAPGHGKSRQMGN